MTKLLILFKSLIGLATLFLVIFYLKSIFNITSNYGNILLLRYKEITIIPKNCVILHKIIVYENV